MIIFHPAGEKGVECHDLAQSHALMNKAVWIDLFEPTEQEEIIVDMASGSTCRPGARCRTSKFPGVSTRRTTRSS